MEQKLKSLIESSDRILVTSHISPDPDAVCSVLLLGLTLKSNFPDKSVTMALEEKSSHGLEFLEGYDEIKFGSLMQSAKETRPDLFISVDAAGINRLCRNDSDKLSNLLAETNCKTVIVDHHPLEETVNADLYLQEKSPANAQLLYELLFEKLNLKKPSGYADIAMIGILRDTGRFKYGITDYSKAFKIANELIEAGANIEQLEYKLDRFSADELDALQELLANTTLGDGYTYSFISDDFSKQWNKSQESLKGACDAYTSMFLRNLDKNLWGFIVYPETLSNEPSYSVSFRSVKGVKNVAELAKKLGGGGHKEAAGAKNILADSVKNAIAQVTDLLK